MGKLKNIRKLFSNFGKKLQLLILEVLCAICPIYTKILTFELQDMTIRGKIKLEAY